MILRDMTRAECEAALSANCIGHLGCISGNRPYVVPIRYVYQKRVFYSFSLPGRKIDSLRFNPRVCVQVEQLANPEEWKSVLLEGLYRELPDDEKDHGEHMRAWQLLQELGNWWEPGAYKPEGAAHPDPDAPARPVFYRVEIDTLSGRQAAMA
ncbi:pyridoxamine 5'-phosphate oxidase family protein [Shinella sp. PSBB067]|nr:pyridoxamine 5'-phosphate oxidase family protein [Shinella sp. PSBB067]QRI62436.1 pyridoxamine 5'-phosphate oxidase family protein [Shinella sp. PSBB067]